MKAHAKLQLRLPQDLKAWLEVEASRNERSMNWQVVAILREKMAVLTGQDKAHGAGAKA